MFVFKINCLFYVYFKIKLLAMKRSITAFFICFTCKLKFDIKYSHFNQCYRLGYA